LGARTTTIGRGTEVDIRIDDPGVSRRHAEFRLSAAGGFSIIDLASTNGTFIGDERVAERVLSDGDEIRVGATVLTYRAG
jgi:pSer/pThr/pTyr-binding forkhead associated (FHA) protein